MNFKLFSARTSFSYKCFVTVDDVALFPDFDVPVVLLLVCLVSSITIFPETKVAFKSQFAFRKSLQTAAFSLSDHISKGLSKFDRVYGFVGIFL